MVHARTLEALESIDVADHLVRLGVQATRFTIRDRDRVLVPVIEAIAIVDEAAERT